MPTCSECGAEAGQYHTFCPECRAPLDRDTATTGTVTETATTDGTTTESSDEGLFGDSPKTSSGVEVHGVDEAIAEVEDAIASTTGGDDTTDEPAGSDEFEWESTTTAEEIADIYTRDLSERTDFYALTAKYFGLTLATPLVFAFAWQFLGSGFLVMLLVTFVFGVATLHFLWRDLRRDWRGGNGILWVFAVLFMSLPMFVVYFLLKYEDRKPPWATDDAE